MGKKILYFITDEDKTGIELAIENDKDEITICLLQNAVYFANKTGKEIEEALNKNKIVIACKDDVEIRGLKNLIFKNIKLLDYGEIIEEIISNESIINF